MMGGTCVELLGQDAAKAVRRMCQVSSAAVKHGRDRMDPCIGRQLQLGGCQITLIFE